MKYTLLQLTQNILSSLDSDEVNSIDDTQESRQVAQLIRTTYFNIMSRANLPEHKQLFKLIASAEDETPVLMYRPDDVSKVEWVKYNKEDVEGVDNFKYVTILPLQQFIDMVQSLDSAATEVESFTLNGFDFKYVTTKHPDYCTIINDYYFVFDSYNEDFDDTLTGNNTMCFGQKIPTFELVDSYVPDMDDQQFPLLLNEAKSLAFVELKQMKHDKAEQESRRQWITLQRTKRLGPTPTDFESLPHFGRK